MYSPVVKRDATTTGGQWLANGLSAENGMSNGRSPVWHAIAKAFAPAMAQLGVPNANGSEQVVPVTAVTFSFFLVGNVGFVIFREHGWHTWVRLRASPRSRLQQVTFRR